MGSLRDVCKTTAESRSFCNRVSLDIKMTSSDVQSTVSKRGISQIKKFKIDHHCCEQLVHSVRHESFLKSISQFVQLRGWWSLFKLKPKTMSSFRQLLALLISSKELLFALEKVSYQQSRPRSLSWTRKFTEFHRKLSQEHFESHKMPGFPHFTLLLL